MILDSVSAADVFGAMAVTAFLVRLVPQPLKLARTRVPDGVSPLSAINVVLTEVAALVYGLTAGLVPVWIVSVPALPLALWMLWLLRHEVTRRDLAAGLAYVALIVGTWSFGVLGVVLGLSVVLNYGPQVWTALRSDRLEGLASATWWLAIADALLWSAYGFAVDDPAILFYGAMMVGAATTILVRIGRTRRVSASAPALVAEEA